MGMTLIQQHFHIGLLYIHVYLLVFGSPVYAQDVFMAMDVCKTPCLNMTTSEISSNTYI